MKPTPIIDMFSGTGELARAERGSGTRSSLIHEALDMAVTGGADLIVAENVPGGHRTYLDLALWTNATGLPEPRLKDDEGRLNAAFVEWLMGLPSAHAVGASIRLAGNAVVRLQARLMLQRGLTTINDTRGTLR